MSAIVRGYVSVTLLHSLFASAIVSATEQSAVSQPSTETCEASLAPEAEAADLAQILEEWQRAASKIARLDARFFRYTYDLTFDTEKRSEGKMAFDIQGRGAYRAAPVPIKLGDTSRRLSQGGKPYSVIRDDPERWHWTGDRVIIVNEQARTYQSIALNLAGPDTPSPLETDERATDNSPIELVLAEEPSKEPPNQAAQSFAELFAGLLVGLILSLLFIGLSQDSNWAAAYADALRNPPLAHPFFLATPIGDLQRDFQIKLVRQTDSAVWLEFRPLGSKYAINYRGATVILDRVNYTPKAIKIIDPQGTKEIVYVLSDVRINAPTTGLFPVEHLNKPNLQGLQLCSP